MKRFLYLSLVLTIVLMSCQTNYVVMNKFNCRKNIDETKIAISKIMMDEGLILNSNMANVSNLVQYTSIEKLLTLSTQKYSITWQLNFEDNLIIAIPRLNLSGGYVAMVGNVPPSTVVLGDETHDTYTEYWNVRFKLEEFCGEKVLIVKELDIKSKSEGGKSMKEKSLQGK